MVYKQFLRKKKSYKIDQMILNAIIMREVWLLMLISQRSLMKIEEEPQHFKIKVSLISSRMPLKISVCSKK
jgi:hypothetical protein